MIQVMKSKKLPLFIFAAAAAALVLHSGCPARQPTGKDAEMMTATRQIARLVDEYFREFAEYPENIEQVRPMLPPAVKWPVNPYNGAEIADTISRDFDAE